MLRNKKGAALLQVLLVSAVLAGMATMLLRASLSRTSTSRRMRRDVSAELLVNRCQWEVNALWSFKNPTAYANDLKDCYMVCKRRNSNNTCSRGDREHTCEYEVDRDGDSVTDITYTVTATMEKITGEQGRCKITYKVTDDKGGSEVILN